MKRKRRKANPDRPFLPDAPLPRNRESREGDEFMEEFERYIEAVESEPTTTLAELLISDGMELPAPDAFTESSVHDKLWEVIEGLARHRHFLTFTDHLSDLELYQKLWTDTLNDPTNDLTPEMGNCACHLDLVGEGTEESGHAWLRYYADDFVREMWAKDFPEDDLPEQAPPPHDRDRLLRRLERDTRAR